MSVENRKAYNKDNQFLNFKYQQKKSLQSQFLYPFVALYTNCAILFAGGGEGLIDAFALQINTTKLLYFITCQEFSANSDRIISLSSNESEDLLISGSGGGEIKFWKKDNLSWTHLYTIDAERRVEKFSLNASETKLIVYDSGRRIIKMFKLQSNFQWTINQTIQSDGKFICFIKDNQFIVQSQQQGNYLEIYNYDERKELYILSERFHLSYNHFARQAGILFPPQFIKEKSILIVKNSGCINFFQIDSEGNYIKQQTNKFDTIAVDGKVTNNGKFLVTILGYPHQLYLSTYQSLE